MGKIPMLSVALQAANTVRVDAIFFTAVHGNVLYQPKTQIQAGCGRTAGTEKRQGNAHNRKQAQAHSQVKDGLCGDHAEESKANKGT